MCCWQSTVQLLRPCSLQVSLVWQLLIDLWKRHINCFCTLQGALLANYSPTFTETAGCHTVFAIQPWKTYSCCMGCFRDELICFPAFRVRCKLQHNFHRAVVGCFLPLQDFPLQSLLALQLLHNLFQVQVYLCCCRGHCWPITAQPS